MTHFARDTAIVVSALIGIANGVMAAQPVTITDSSGNAVNVTGNALNVTGSATSVVTSPAPSVTNTATTYATGLVLGGIVSFTGQPTTGAIANVNITFNSGTFTDTVDVYFFNANPTGGGTTDHAAFALTSTDQGKLIGVMHASDCTAYGVLAQCQVLYQSQFYTLAAAGTTIYAVPVVRGTWAGSFTGTTDIGISLNVVK